MASQQILFAETIAGMKKALKRKAYDSDSDDSVRYNGNRGQKLKKRARFTQQGQLAPPSGPNVYKETIEYAGTTREIISRNPPLIDDYGYEVDSDEDEERVRDAIANAADFNPYAKIRLEHILAPLTAVTDLPAHPSISRPFTSKTLTELANQSCEIMRKENRSLWKVKHLMTGLCGDYSWAPCSRMLGPNDIDLFSDSPVLRGLQKGSTTGELEESSPATLNGDSPPVTHPGSLSGDAGAVAAADGNRVNGDGPIDDVSMADASASLPELGQRKSKRVKSPSNKEQGPAETKPGGARGDEEKQEEKQQEKNGSNPDVAGVMPDSNGQQKDNTSNGTGKTAAGDEQGEKQDADSIDRTSSRGTKEIARRSDNYPTASVLSEAGSEYFVHPFFAPPPSARPDRDFALPENEAEDVRRLMALYVQKQEEICRGTRRLCDGLLKADRLRKDVLRWSKAEAHCGLNRDMSDGEDWYDKEEWGLTEDLKKGQDEEEEDTAQTAKKTRSRR